ncbi:MAG: carbohydrate ABC transporter permease [Oscillospiraceae bacterium]|nr:carbohydrate ABC transporter permease [Oscillospiraceae bacterium]
MTSMNVSRTKNKIRWTAEDISIETISLIIGIFIFIVTLYPFYYCLILSLNEGRDATMGGIYFWPRAFTFRNYTRFFTDVGWLNAIWISVSKTALGTCLCLFFTCLIAYGLSYPGLALRNTYGKIFLFCMYFNAGLIPTYMVIRSLGLTNNFLVYIIPSMFSIYFCILARSFFKSIPFELVESAKLDGASDFFVFVRIIIPLSKPLLATLALYTAVERWNAWSDTAFYAPTNKNLRSLSFMMRNVILQTVTSPSMSAEELAARAAAGVTETARSVQMAAMMITIAPIIIIYPFVQKYFVKGIMLGAVKG